jgi:Trk K+ transport system NAD-binding subunit
MRGSKYLEPADGETVLEADDKLLILGRRDGLMDFSESLL